MSFDPEIISDWIALHRLQEGTPEYELLAPAWEAAYDMTHNHPEDAWQFILGALNEDSSKSTLENLSAGPLEDLLVYHGPTVIDRVEMEARRNPRLAQLLGGVWQNAMANDIWVRVKAVWDRRGWDGIPVE